MIEINRERRLFDGAVVILAVSGGVDSMVLMHLFAQIHTHFTGQVHVATLDHGLRAEAGADDARFVYEVATAWGFPCTQDRVDVNALAAEWKMSTESAARRARYKFLARVAETHGAKEIMTAHHADDQAETVLMRIIRGTGIDGLAAMTWRSPLPYHAQFEVVRPMLGFTRAEIEAYARDHGIVFRTDATNADTTYTRNRIRHEVIPILREMNPNVVGALARLAEIAQGEVEVLDESQEDLTRLAVATPDQVLLPRQAYENHLKQAARHRRYLYWAVAQLNLPDADYETIGYDDIERVRRILQNGTTGTRALLGGGLVVRLSYQHVIVERVGTPADDIENGSLPLLNNNAETHSILPGTYTAFGTGSLLGVFVKKLEPDDALTSNAACWVAIPQAMQPIETANLVLRARQSGDTFAPLGMGGKRKSVAAWMVDHKIPRDIRNRIPLITIEGRIAAMLVGRNYWIVDEAFKVVDKSISVLHIEMFSFA